MAEFSILLMLAISTFISGVCGQWGQTFFNSDQGVCHGDQSSYNDCGIYTPGGMCSGVDGVDKSWCCETGWAFCVANPEICNGANSTPADDQIRCGPYNNKSLGWCCMADYEGCPEDILSMTYSCTASWSNELYNGPLSTESSASSAYQAQGSLSTVTSTTSHLSSTTSSITSPTSALALLPTDTLSTIPTMVPNPGPSISSGAIIGITVAAAIIIIAIVGFVVWRLLRRLNSTTLEAVPSANHADQEKSSSSNKYEEPSAYHPLQELPAQAVNGPHEIYDEGVVMSR